MKELDEFFIRMGIAPELIDMERTTNAFVDEMEKGLSGEKSSLKMIPSFIDRTFNPVPGESVAVVDAGGTNLRVCEVKFDDNLLPVLVSIERYPMPGSVTPIESDQFFEQLAGYLGNVLKRTKKIGFCFSYAVDIQPDKDGKIILLSKEVVVHNSIGKVIGEELKKALKRLNLASFDSITVLNDTTATLLGGYIYNSGREYSDYIGFVLGTGTNICYYEKNINVRKNALLSASDGNTIINVESGGFDKIFAGELDREYWNETLEPGEAHLEKMISGQYLGKLFLKYLQKAAKEEHLFTEGTRQAVQSLNQLHTKDLSEFLENSSDDSVILKLASTDQDLQTIRIMLDKLLERAAKLVVCSFAACIRKSEADVASSKPILITAEGTTFYKVDQLRNKIEYYIDHYIVKELNQNVKVVKIEDAVVYGSAYAAVSEK